MLNKNTCALFYIDNDWWGAGGMNKTRLCSLIVFLNIIAMQSCSSQVYEKALISVTVVSSNFLLQGLHLVNSGDAISPNFDLKKSACSLIYTRTVWLILRRIIISFRYFFWGGQGLMSCVWQFQRPLLNYREWIVFSTNTNYLMFYSTSRWWSTTFH